MAKQPRSNVLAIPDLHAPCMLPSYPSFLADLYARYKCDRAVFLGDIIDWSALSFHARDPSLPSIQEEMKRARRQIHTLYNLFPDSDCITGNHDCLTFRQAATVGIHEHLIRSFNDIFDTPKWRWQPRFGHIIIDSVIYQHGDAGRAGKTPALLNALSDFRSVVQGHHHTLAFVHWYCNKATAIFGCQAGTGIKHNHPALAYSRSTKAKPIVSAAVILQGEQAIVERMLL